MSSYPGNALQLPSGGSLVFAHRASPVARLPSAAAHCATGKTRTPVFCLFCSGSWPVFFFSVLVLLFLASDKATQYPANGFRDGINKKPGGRPTAHFSTVFPLEKTRMVIDGAAERRLQAIHRDRCTWWRAMVPPWCIHSLVRSLVCRVDRRPAAASDLHRWLGARCELPHEDDCVSSAGSGAQQTTC